MLLKYFRCAITRTVVRVSKKDGIGNLCLEAAFQTQETLKELQRKDCFLVTFGMTPLIHETRGSCACCLKEVSGFICTKFDVFLCLK